eukprot:10682745-Lingulodinium_polyedra.AAC.1
MAPGQLPLELPRGAPAAGDYAAGAADDRGRRGHRRRRAAHLRQRRLEARRRQLGRRSPRGGKSRRIPAADHGQGR